MTDDDRIDMLELHVTELRRELDELRHQLSQEVRTRLVIVVDPDETDDIRHEVRITPAELLICETYDGSRVTVDLCADNGCATVAVRADDDNGDPAAEMQAFNSVSGFGHDSQERPAAMLAIGNTEIVSFEPFDVGSYTMVDVFDLAVLA